MSWTLGTLAALGVLVGCGGADTDAAAPNTSVPADVSEVPVPTPERTPEPTPAEPTGERSQRGNLIKKIGETAFNYDPDRGPEARWLEFKVTEIEVDGECTEEFAEPPENGHMLFVTIAASTSSEWPAFVTEAGLTAVDFSSTDFTIIGADGVTEHDLATAATYGCLPEGEQLPAQIGPGENVVGKVILDTANTTGILVYKPWYAGGSSGWEWQY
jgi:hypothetical protein